MKNGWKYQTSIKNILFRVPGISILGSHTKYESLLAITGILGHFRSALWSRWNSSRTHLSKKIWVSSKSSFSLLTFCRVSCPPPGVISTHNPHNHTMAPTILDPVAVPLSPAKRFRGTKRSPASSRRRLAISCFLFLATKLWAMEKNKKPWHVLKFCLKSKCVRKKKWGWIWKSPSRCKMGPQKTSYKWG